jgi:hypothetical protein
MSSRWRIARRASIVTLLAVAVVLLGVRAYSRGAVGPAAGGGTVLASADGSGDDDGEHAFTVSGSVAGLFPGAHRDLVLTITNALPFAISVTRVSVRVGDAGAACGATNLAVSGFTGSRRVPAHGTATVSLPVTMSHAAGDGCQGAHFPLSYQATATRAGDRGDSSVASGRCAASRAVQCA